MAMTNPAHPGEIIREKCLARLGLSVTSAADGLGGVAKDAVNTAEWSCLRIA
jgi:plasmid maintenance system antidote protein VapI